MKFKIINDKISDEIVIEAETIDEIRQITKYECEKRGWKSEDCYSLPLN